MAAFMRVAVVAALVVSTACASSLPMRQVEDDRWQVSVSRDGPALRLVVSDQKSGQIVANNANFLPRALDEADGEWALSAFTLVSGELTVAMQLRPRPGSGNMQDKRFSFDLRMPRSPLVAYETEVTRAGQSDRQRFDLLAGKSFRCVTSAALPSKSCEPQVEMLNAAALVPLASMGSAESYAPPIKLDIVY